MADENNTQQPDDSEPTPERQAELRAAYEKNVAAGRPPYKGVQIRTRGELSWVVREHHWYADEDAPAANLSGADLNGANLSGFHLDVASLSGATLRGADLSHARFYSADLSGAKLRAANLSGTNLGNATLSRADLREARMDANTRLTDVLFDSHTRLVDVVWNGAPVTRLNWQHLALLGDEAEARDPGGKRPDTFVTSRTIRAMRTALRPPRGPQEDDLRAALKANEQLSTLLAYQDAVLANRQVVTLLRS